MPDFGDHRTMGCSRADLQRWVGELTGSPPPDWHDDRLAIALDGWTLTLRAVPLPARRIGLVRLQHLDVRFEYPPPHAEAARAWIAAFDRHTQRGGG
jgi:hypothetical protein